MTTYMLHGFGSSAAAFRAAWSDSCSLQDETVFLDGFEKDRLTQQLRWFPFTARQEQLADYVIKCADRLERVLGAKHHGASELRFVGHSQGGMLAMELACRGILPISQVVCFGAYMPCSTALRHTPPVAVGSIILYSSGKDEFIHRSDVTATVAYLSRLGVKAISDRVASSLPHAFGSEWLNEENFREVSYV
ncbi:UNVERIFIED_ORG: hypothetical protein BTE55_09840 [Rhizobium sophorae]